MSGVSRVIENALKRELEHASEKLANALKTAAKDLAGAGGIYTSPRLAARFALERLNAAVDYHDAVDEMLKKTRRESPATPGAEVDDPRAYVDAFGGTDFPA